MSAETSRTPPLPAAEAPWIVCCEGSGPDPYMIECKRCGETQKVAVPISVRAFLAAAQAFSRRHSSCPGLACPAEVRVERP